MTCPACIEKPEIFLSTSCQRLKKFPEQLQPIYENEFLGIYTVQVVPFCILFYPYLLFQMPYCIIFGKAINMNFHYCKTFWMLFKLQPEKLGTKK